MRKGNFNRVERAELVGKGLGVSSQELVSGEVIAHAKSAKFAKSDVESQKSGTDFFNAEKQSSRETEKRLVLAAKNAESAKDWPMVRLGDVCETISVRGHQIKQSDIRPCGLYPVVTQSENEIEGFSDEDFCISDVPVVLFGDHTCIVKSLVNPFIVGADGTKLLKPKGVNFEYFVYAVKNAASKLVDGKYRRHYSDLIESSIPLPPIEVQKEIVERLEKELGEADKVAAEFKRMADLADKEFKAELDETFGGLREKGSGVSSQELGLAAKNAKGAKDWPMVRLGDVCEVLDSRRKPITKRDRVLGSVPYYGATGIVDYVKDFIFDERLVLLGEDGAKWGSGDRSAFIIEGKTWVNNHAHVLRMSERIFDKFLVYYLNYSDLSYAITGVTVPKLNQQKMCEIQIPLPPLSVQKEIVAKLDAAKERCEKLKAEAERGLTAAENLRKAILSEAFEL